VSSRFVLKRSDVKKTSVLTELFIWRCPICYREVISYNMEKVIAGAKLHLIRVHKLEVVVED
jgi:hypothetical protein